MSIRRNEGVCFKKYRLLQHNKGENSNQEEKGKENSVLK